MMVYFLSAEVAVRRYGYARGMNHVLRNGPKEDVVAVT